MRKRTSTPSVDAADRHADLVAALAGAVFDSEAVTDRPRRAAAATPGAELPPELASYVTRVRDASYRITDADIAALRTAGHGEEEIFELTIDRKSVV